MKRESIRNVAAILCALAWGSAGAASLDLLRDVNVVGVPVDSAPEFLGTVGARAVFSATTSATGREPYVTDGTEAGTVLLRDIAPGANGVGIREAGRVGGGLLFFVAAGAATDLWVTDGTPAGTARVAGFATEFVDWLAQLPNGTALITAAGDLWRTDGTPAGTVRIGTGVQPRRERDRMAMLGSRLYFLAGAPPGSAEIWETDGTAAGTRSVYRVTMPGATLEALTDAGSRLVATLVSDNAPSLQGVDLAAGALVPLTTALPQTPTIFDRVNTTTYAAFFVGPRLWRTDGTPAGTFPVTPLGDTFGASSYRMQRAGERVVFAFRLAGGTDRTLWATDGTVAGTAPIYEFEPGSGSYSQPLASDGGVVYAAVGVGGNRQRIGIVRTDGTIAGSRLLEFPADIVAFDPQGGLPSGYLAGSRFLVTVSEPLVVENVIDRVPLLYATDGVAPLAPVFRGDRGGFPSTAVVADRLYFSAARGGTGYEPWVTDGTSTGTRLTRDLAAQGANSGSKPRQFARLGDTVLFAADDGQLGRELWKTDGTPGGTVLVKDLLPGFSSSSPSQLLVAGAQAFFRAQTSEGVSEFNTGVWRSDGTAAGTYPLLAESDMFDLRIPNCPRWGGALGTDFAFLAYDSLLRRYVVIRTDGTRAGTRRVAEFPEDQQSNASPCNVTSLGDRLVFAFSLAGQIEPWVTDGTTAGTFRLRDLDGTSASSMQETDPITRVGSLAVFAGRDGGSGPPILWRTDGTAAGTVPLVEQATGSAPAVSVAPVAFGSRVLFAGISRTGAALGTRGLYVSDGTDTGTRRLRDNLEFDGGIPLVAGGGRAFFIATEGTQRSLYVTDGREGGTRAVTAVQTFGVGDPGFVVDGGALYFVATASQDAKELWMSDGTAVGTRRLAPLAAPGADPDAAIALSSLLPGRLLVAAADPTVGIEPFAIVNTRPVATPDTGRVQSGAFVTLALTANDTDADGAINRAGVYVTTPSANGLVEVLDNGSIRYTPRSGFTGTDTFEYATIDEWGGVSASALVTLTVEAPPPPPPSPPPPSGGGGGGGGSADARMLALLMLAVILRFLGAARRRGMIPGGPPFAAGRAGGLRCRSSSCRS